MFPMFLSLKYNRSCFMLAKGDVACLFTSSFIDWLTDMLASMSEGGSDRHFTLWAFSCDSQATGTVNLRFLTSILHSSFSCSEVSECHECR